MYSVQALRLALSLQGTDFSPSSEAESDVALRGFMQYWALRAVKWQSEGTLSAQEVTLKFQEWLLARQIASLFEANIGPLLDLEETLQTAQLPAANVLKAIEREYDEWLTNEPLLGYDMAGNAVVRQPAKWIHRAEAVFKELDSEGRRYLVSDSLTYTGRDKFLHFASKYTYCAVDTLAYKRLPRFRFASSAWPGAGIP